MKTRNIVSVTLAICFSSESIVLNSSRQVFWLTLSQRLPLLIKEKWLAVSEIFFRITATGIAPDSTPDSLFRISLTNKITTETPANVDNLL